MKAPLRLVVEKNILVDVSVKPEEYSMNIPKWKLECGHLVHPPKDMFGERYPTRMRCEQCKQEKPWA